MGTRPALEDAAGASPLNLHVPRVALAVAAAASSTSKQTPSPMRRPVSQLRHQGRDPCRTSEPDKPNRRIRPYKYVRNVLFSMSEVRNTWSYANV